MTSGCRRNALALLLGIMPARSLGSAPLPIHVPRLPLIQALGVLSVQTGITVGREGAIDPTTRSHAVQGRLAPGVALDRLLVGTGYRAEAIDDRSFRLTARADRIPAEAPLVAAPLDIIVTASKRNALLGTGSGDVEVQEFSSPLGGNDQRHDLAALSGRIPSLSATALGPGHNKLFVRGIADSSFSGHSQATLGEYLGEARINYDAPDPGLLLYDVKQVELLKGPQGTLYGGGTLGGVLRIEPMRPNLERASGFLDFGGATTAGGAASYDVATMLNVPLSPGAAGVRLLAYRTLDGGYIDDVLRGRSNVNRSVVNGGRAQFKAEVGGWTVNLLGARQDIHSRDGNYAVEGLPAFSRATSSAQPSSNHFDLLDLDMHRAIGALDLVTSTALERNCIAVSYDASAVALHPASFDDTRRIRSLTHETRLSHSSPSGVGWVAGVSVLAQRERENQQAGSLDIPGLTSGFVSNELDIALYGQGTIRRGAWMLTAGLRMSYSRLRGKSDEINTALSPSEVHLTDWRPLPMAQLSWVATREITISLGYRQGFRSGGVEVTHFQPTEFFPGGALFTTYMPDFIRVADLDVAFRTTGRRPFTIDATISGVDWSNAQTDLVDDAGLVITQNSGNSNLLNVNVALGWRARPDLSLKAGIAANKEYFKATDPDVVAEAPSVPAVALYAEADWTARLAAGWTGRVEARGAYRGKSRLGPGAFHDIRQGDVLSSDIAFQLAHGRYSATLSVANLVNDRSNLFSYGNPFTLRSERQETPQRPRTIRLGFHADL